MSKHSFLIFGAIAMAITSLAASQPPVDVPQTPETITDISDAWARLYEDKDFKADVLTVKGRTDIPDLAHVKRDNGKKGFGDKTSSVKYQIPKGWKLVLFDDHDYKDSLVELKGTGRVVENADLGSFNDKTSSIRWDRDPQ